MRKVNKTIKRIFSICPCNPSPESRCITLYEYDDGSVFIINEKKQEIEISPEDQQILKEKIKNGEI